MHQLQFSVEAREGHTVRMTHSKASLSRVVFQMIMYGVAMITLEKGVESHQATGGELV